MCLCCLFCFLVFFFFKQKTAYEMRISDWSSDVCSSDLGGECRGDEPGGAGADRAGRSGAHPPDRAVSGAAADRGCGSDGRTAQKTFDRGRENPRDRKSVV